MTSSEAPTNGETRPPEWGCDECYRLTVEAAERAGVLMADTYLTILCPTHSGSSGDRDV